MKLLFDTHALIWWYEGSAQIRQAVKDAIFDPENQVMISPVSAFEMTTKRRIGKLHGIDPLIDDLPDYLRRNDFALLPVGLDHAALAGSLAFSHRDPFDRLLIAQAMIEQAYLVSNEKLFDEFGVRRLW